MAGTMQSQGMTNWSPDGSGRRPRRVRLPAACAGLEAGKRPSSATCASGRQRDHLNALFFGLDDLDLVGGHLRLGTPVEQATSSVDAGRADDPYYVAAADDQHRPPVSGVLPSDLTQELDAGHEAVVPSSSPAAHARGLVGADGDNTAS
jgi:hypothetical protein